MIFKETYQQVLDGSKTQTRRVVKPRETLLLLDGNKQSVVSRPMFEAWRLKWQEGRTYAVQPGRGKKSIGRIRITKIRRERLQEITDSDVLAEGIRLRPATLGNIRWDFKRLWNSLYRKPYRWEDDIEVWVLEFEKV